MNELQDELTWQALYDWAEQQPEGSIVGVPGSYNACPIACFLGQRAGGTWDVDAGVIRRDEDGSEEGWVPPRWVSRVVIAVDARIGESIRREEFLAILETGK